ncbi:MAG: diaminopimelate decarboxylase [Actinomycetota bacterium]
MRTPEEPRPTGRFPHGNPWPGSQRTSPDGFVVAGAVLPDLARRFGTPLLVFDEREIRDRMRAVRALFPRVAYAVKAFTAHAVIRVALEEGLDLLCASGGELDACLRAGAPAARLQLHGNAKTDDELRLAVDAGIGLVIADSLEELRRLDAAACAAGRVQAVLLRVIPEVEVQTHEKIATGHAASKFGMPLDEVLDAARFVVAAGGLRLDGLQAHAGSQVLDVEPYVRVLDVLVELAARIRDASGTAATVLDVGGGFGVTYDGEEPLGVDSLAEALLPRVRTACAERGLGEPALQVEPGRAFVANAGITLYTVLARKQVGGRTLVAVDGGMGDNLRPMLYGARHAVAAAGRVAQSHMEPMTVVGRHCESGDVLAEDVSLPGTLATGDLLAVAGTGAYTYPLASNYNRFGRPAVVGVRDGAATLWLRREDAADLDRLEAPAGRVAPPGAAAPEGIDIRPARPGDVRAFLPFWRRAIADERTMRTDDQRTTAAEYRSRFRRSYGEDEAHILALQGGRVVGYVMAGRDRNPVTRHVASLGLAVAADRRRRGVGTALLAAAIRWGRGVGVEKVLLSVYPDNVPAIAMYRRFGFVEEGRLSRQSRKSYGDVDEILMAAWIGPAEPGEEPSGGRDEG